MFRFARFPCGEREIFVPVHDSELEFAQAHRLYQVVVGPYFERRPQAVDFRKTADDHYGRGYSRFADRAYHPVSKQFVGAFVSKSQIREENVVRTYRRHFADEIQKRPCDAYAVGRYPRLERLPYPPSEVFVVFDDEDVHMAGLMP